jgi:hypothetical protein
MSHFHSSRRKSELVTEMLETQPERWNAKELRSLPVAELEDLHERYITTPASELLFSEIEAMPVEDANDQITVASEPDPINKTFHPSGLENLASESIGSARVTTKMKAEHERQLARVLKPSGRVVYASGSDEATETVQELIERINKRLKPAFWRTHGKRIIPRMQDIGDTLAN